MSKFYYCLIGDSQVLVGKTCACGQSIILYHKHFLNFYRNILTVLFEIKMSVWKKLIYVKCLKKFKFAFKNVKYALETKKEHKI